MRGAVLSAITTFLQSDQALKILGLPGLALLLAFVFYRTMVASKLVRPVGRNQSFIILILIIAYFLICSVLLIWVYRPEHSQPQPMPTASNVAANDAKPSDWDKLDKVMRQASLSTPLTSFDALLGPATGEFRVEQSDLSLRTYLSLEDGLLAGLTSAGNRVVAIAAWDAKGRLKVPTMRVGFADERGNIREYTRLSNFDLEFAAQHCGGLHEDHVSRGGFYAFTPCYFGRPGSYNNYVFIFRVGEQSPFINDCPPADWAERGLTIERIRQCGAGRERPVGFVVAADEAQLGAIIDTFVAVLSGDIG